MSRSEFIEIAQLCRQYQLEMQFFSTLEDYELIQVVRVKESPCVYLDELRRIEKMVRLHKELQINMEGIQAVINLLEKVEFLQDELARVRSRLSLYE
jgi:hypothetical protein